MVKGLGVPTTVIKPSKRPDVGTLPVRLTDTVPVWPDAMFTLAVLELLNFTDAVEEEWPALAAALKTSETVLGPVLENVRVWAAGSAPPCARNPNETDDGMTWIVDATAFCACKRPEPTSVIEAGPESSEVIRPDRL